MLASRRPNTEAQLEQQSQRRLRGGARRHVEVGELLLEVVAGQPVELEDVEHLPGGLGAQVSGGVGTETSSTSTMSSAPNPHPNPNPYPNPNPNPNPDPNPDPNPLTLTLQALEEILANDKFKELSKLEYPQAS